VTEVKIFKSERSLKFAAKRCQYLRRKVYELILEGIVSIADIRNAGMMVPSSFHVYGTLCDQMHTITMIKIGRKLFKRIKFVRKNDKQYEVLLK
jgi:hypothetical protein